MRRCLCGRTGLGAENQRWLRSSAMVLRLAVTLLSRSLARPVRRESSAERAARAPEYLAPGAARRVVAGRPAQLGPTEDALGVRHQRRVAAVRGRDRRQPAHAAVRI